MAGWRVFGRRTIKKNVPLSVNRRAGKMSPHFRSESKKQTNKRRKPWETSTSKTTPHLTIALTRRNVLIHNVYAMILYYYNHCGTYFGSCVPSTPLRGGWNPFRGDGTDGDGGLVDDSRLAASRTNALIRWWSRSDVRPPRGAHTAFRLIVRIYRYAAFR